jgi:hypothetical protein
MTNRLSELVESYRLAGDQPPPSGHILVHGRITARTPDFRAWWATPGEGYAFCDCGWRPDLGKHYRVARVGALIPRRKRRGVRPAA